MKFAAMTGAQINRVYAQLARDVLALLVRMRDRGEAIADARDRNGAAWAVLFAVSMMRQKYLGAPRCIPDELAEAIAIFESLVESFDMLAAGISPTEIGRRMTRGPGGIQ